MTVSVIVAATPPIADLASCLDSLMQPAFRGEIEIIVADCTTTVAHRLVAANYPSIKLLHRTGRLTIPDLIKQAFEQAAGEILALADSHCVFPPDWLEMLRIAHNSDFGVVGGAVEHNGPETLAGWATYFADYGPFMLPEPRRETSLMAGNHVSYKRSLIETSAESMQDGYWKVFLHWDLEQRGIRFLFDPKLVLTRRQPETFLNFARRYFRNGFDFAAKRAERMSVPARLARLMTAPALPPLLFYRRFIVVWRKNTRRTRLLASTPLLAVFVTCWSAGELIGYLRGRARPTVVPGGTPRHRPPHI
jgi:glycosyltransferase involved in cell wall biosynthesis